MIKDEEEMEVGMIIKIEKNKKEIEE